MLCQNLSVKERVPHCLSSPFFNQHQCVNSVYFRQTFPVLKILLYFRLVQTFGDRSHPDQVFVIIEGQGWSNPVL